jgi:hypothetical protein
VQQTVPTRQDLHDRAELEQLEHGAFVDLADLDLGGEVFNTLLSTAGRFGIGGGDGDVAVVLDVDGGAGFFSDRTDA